MSKRSSVRKIKCVMKPSGLVVSNNTSTPFLYKAGLFFYDEREANCSAEHAFKCTFPTVSISEPQPSCRGGDSIFSTLSMPLIGGTETVLAMIFSVIRRSSRQPRTAFALLFQMETTSNIKLYMRASQDFFSIYLQIPKLQFHISVHSNSN